MIAVLSEGIHTSVVFERYIYSFCNPVTLFLLYFLYLIEKLRWKMLKKVHRSELNVWLESLYL